MNDNERIDESTFLLFAAKCYSNPQCYDTLEFYEDLKRFRYIKRLLNKYESTGELRERLILNHIISLNNVFGAKNTARMLFFRLEGYEQFFAPFLIMLGSLPTLVEGIGHDNRTVYCDEILMDKIIIDKLRKI